MAITAEREANRDEYFVRRLEAFGDIVIGFSLALLAVSLIVPNHARSLVVHTTWLAAYAWTFALICTMWESHYWTFRYVFVPTRASVLLNYVKLGLIVLLIFGVQVLLKALDVGDPQDVIVANELYWGCLAAYWIVTGLLLAQGMFARSKPLPSEIAERCKKRLLRIAATVPMVVAGILIGAAGAAANMTTTVSLFLVAGIALGAVVSRFATRR